MAIEPGVRVAIACPAWVPPLLALQFLTRVPVPVLSRLPGEVVNIGLGRAVGWFPLIGALVGAVTAATLLAAEQVWPRIVAVLLALVVEARLTGAFHEDAVADFCDGAGGGRDRAHVRRIMKDSRIGSYGALGLGLAVALRAALMLSLPASPVFVFAAIVAASSFGRLIAVIAMSAIPPAPDDRAEVQAAPEEGGRTQTVSPSSAAAQSSGAAQRSGARRTSGSAGRSSSLAKDIGSVLPPSGVVVAAVTAMVAVLPFALLAPFALFFAIIGAAGFLLWLRVLLLRKIGGISGDCLGFAVYAGQLIVLLAATAL